MLPATERTTFQMTASKAEDLAIVGVALTVYRCLLDGMLRATEAKE